MVSLLNTEVHPTREDASDVQPDKPQVPASAQPTGTHLARTLGHHAETPALAPFLGRAPIRRCINVYGEEDPVDIDLDAPAIIASTSNFISRISKEKAAWKMEYAHRNDREEVDLDLGMGVDLDISAPSSQSPDEPTTSHPVPPADSSGTNVNSRHGTGTRFHIPARVVISDKSLWIPPGEFRYFFPVLMTDQRSSYL